jgi:membrane protease YdiL (CAAX protease family)
LNITLPNKVFWKDGAYWLALMAGPVSWCLLFFLTNHAGAPTPPWEAFVKLALIYPILEEIVFRGGIQSFLMERSSLSKKTFSISGANLITSFLFAAAHLLHQSPLWASLVFFPSLIFGWAREKYDSIVPSIVLHSFYNAGFVWLFVQL